MAVDKKALYHVHPSVAYCQAIIENIPAKTGKSVKEWTKILRASGAGEEDFPAILKTQFGLGGSTASILAFIAAGNEKEYASPEYYLEQAPVYVREMYQGGREVLKPIHDALLQMGRKLGRDVKVCPCKTMVPLYRNHVFAQIKPASKTRLDFGLALKHSKKKPGKRLVDTGGLAKGDRITHCIPLKSLGEVDDEVRDWLKIAYDLDSGS